MKINKLFYTMLCSAMIVSNTSYADTAIDTGDEAACRALAVIIGYDPDECNSDPLAPKKKVDKKPPYIYN